MGPGKMMTTFRLAIHITLLCIHLDPVLMQCGICISIYIISIRKLLFLPHPEPGEEYQLSNHFFAYIWIFFYAPSHFLKID